jgi:hypothetical protein
VFSRAVRTYPGFLQPPVQWVRWLGRPERGVDNPPHLDPRLRMGSAMTLIRLSAVIACHGETFTFTFTHLKNHDGKHLVLNGQAFLYRRNHNLNKQMTGRISAILFIEKIDNSNEVQARTIGRQNNITRKMCSGLRIINTVDFLRNLIFHAPGCKPFWLKGAGGYVRLLLA